MNTVVAFKSRVNTTTDTESAPITINARFETPQDLSSDAPITTGSNGNMHGAGTVNIPARIEMPRKIILLDLCYQTG